MGHTTRLLTDSMVSFGDERLVDAKGFAEPLAAFPVEGLGRGAPIGPQNHPVRGARG